MEESYIKPKYKLELSLENAGNWISLPCGIKSPKYIILEDIWEQTGCDMPRERGKWICNHCKQCYFFYLFQINN